MGSNDENILYRGHPSWLSYYLLFLIASLLLIVFWSFDQKSVSMVCLPLSIVGAAILRRRQSYLVTTTLVTRRTGLIANNTDEFPLRHVSSVSVRQSVMERLLGIGSIEFVSVSDSSNRIIFHGVGNPQGIQEAVRPFIGGG